MAKIFKNKKLIIISLVIILILVFIVLNNDKILKIIYPKKFENIVSAYSQNYDVDENLIYSVIKAESNFSTEATSHKGAIGLMQIMEETAKDVIRQNNLDIDSRDVRNELLKVDKNINVGTKYLSTLLQKYQCKELALAAYNAGIGTVDNWIDKGIIKSDGSDVENIPFKETNQYVRKILNYYKVYDKIY